ncbi:hypothetical protein LENED_007704 [Lentinula edodes]|uniref:Uncharacterized protein n=1 Tax=Lentinula edodes TaxID=5353 RepID=A0A1Q3EF74_LENED|nr:hypothetical protein LENED_007704 [Lentinula edodes]
MSSKDNRFLSFSYIGTRYPAEPQFSPSLKQDLEAHLIAGISCKRLCRICLKQRHDDECIGILFVLSSILHGPGSYFHLQGPSSDSRNGFRPGIQNWLGEIEEFAHWIYWFTSSSSVSLDDIFRRNDRDCTSLVPWACYMMVRWHLWIQA